MDIYIYIILKFTFIKKGDSNGKVKGIFYRFQNKDRC